MKRVSPTAILVSLLLATNLLALSTRFFPGRACRTPPAGQRIESVYAVRQAAQQEALKAGRTIYTFEASFRPPIMGGR